MEVLIPSRDRSNIIHPGKDTSNFGQKSEILHRPQGQVKEIRNLRLKNKIHHICLIA